MRYAHVTKMAADPRIAGLPRSHRALWRHVALKADDDGVWRQQVSDRKLAERLEYEVSTLRKARRRLAEDKLMRYVAGIGRTRTIYAVGVVVGATIAEPEYPPPPAAKASPAPEVPPEPPAPLGTQDQIPGIPKQSGHNDVPTDESLPGDTLLQNRATSYEVPRSLWCNDAKMAGAPHKNRRCCHTTTRDLAKVEAARLAAERRATAAAERERHRAEAARLGEGKVERITRGAVAAREQLAAHKHESPTYQHHD